MHSISSLTIASQFLYEVTFPPSQSICFEVEDLTNKAYNQAESTLSHTNQSYGFTNWQVSKKGYHI